MAPRAWHAHSVPLLAVAVLAGYTLDEDLAIHPDGTPTFPAKMRARLRSGDAPDSWRDDRRLLELAVGDDLEAFSDYVQEINQDRIFDEDGRAHDIKEWRQSVRDDVFYRDLMQQHYPEVLEKIVSGTDDEVQAILMAQRKAQLAAAQEKEDL